MARDYLSNDTKFINCMLTHSTWNCCWLHCKIQTDILPSAEPAITVSASAVNWMQMIDTGSRLSDWLHSIAPVINTSQLTIYNTSINITPPSPVHTYKPPGTQVLSCKFDGFAAMSPTAESWMKNFAPLWVECPKFNHFQVSPKWTYPKNFVPISPKIFLSYVPNKLTNLQTN